MGSLTKRRNGDGSTSWDALVRVVGFPATARSFRTKLADELWASRTEARYRGGGVAPARAMTLAMLMDEGLPRLTKPTAAIFDYWREHLATCASTGSRPSRSPSAAIASSAPSAAGTATDWLAAGRGRPDRILTGPAHRLEARQSSALSYRGPLAFAGGGRFLFRRAIVARRTDAEAPPSAFVGSYQWSSGSSSKK